MSWWKKRARTAKFYEQRARLFFILGLIGVIQILIQAVFHVDSLLVAVVLIGTVGGAIVALWQAFTLPFLLIGWHYKRKGNNLSGAPEGPLVKYIFWTAVLGTIFLFLAPLLVLTLHHVQQPPPTNPLDTPQ